MKHLYFFAFEQMEEMCPTGGNRHLLSHLQD